MSSINHKFKKIKHIFSSSQKPKATVKPSLRETPKSSFDPKEMTNLANKIINKPEKRISLDGDSGKHQNPQREESRESSENLQAKIDKIWQKYKSDRESCNIRPHNHVKIKREESFRSIDEILDESLGVKERGDKYAVRGSSVTSRQTFAACLQSESVKTVTDRLATICQSLVRRILKDGLIEYEEFHEGTRNGATNHILNDAAKKLRYCEFLLKNIERKILRDEPDSSDVCMSELP